MLWLGDEDEVAGPNAADRVEHLVEFRLEPGCRCGGTSCRRRDREALLMPHRQNTVHVTYRLLDGRRAGAADAAAVDAFRGYEAPVDRARRRPTRC